MVNDHTTLLFVYGTFLPGQRNYEVVAKRLARRQPLTVGTVEGILLADTKEDLPFLVSTQPEQAGLLAKIDRQLGHTVRQRVAGKVLELQDPRLALHDIDRFETIGPEKRHVPFSNLYRRIRIPVQTRDGVVHAWAYVANPDKGLVSKLVTQIGRRAKVALWGSWARNGNESRHYSLDAPKKAKLPTFGTETEYTLHLGKDGVKLDGIVRSSRQIRVSFDGSDRVRHYNNLHALLREETYSTLVDIYPLVAHKVRTIMGPRKAPTVLDVGGREYYHPVRLPIPTGEVYIDGELFERTENREACIVSPTRMSRPKKNLNGDRFVETASFPNVTGPGTSLEAARQELRNRAFMSVLFADIKRVRASVDTAFIEEQDVSALEELASCEPTRDKKKHSIDYSGRLSVQAHSMHHNTVLDPSLQIGDKTFTLDEVMTQVPCEEHDPETTKEKAKFTDDIAQIAMQAFGPAYTLFFSGSRESHTCYKVRDGNRFELRGDAIEDLEQYAAGVLLLSATVETLSRIIKEQTVVLACEEATVPRNELTQRNIRRAYAKVTPELIRTFLPAALASVKTVLPDTRTGYMVAPGEYHQAIQQNIDAELSVMHPDGVADTMTARDMLQNIFYDARINDTIREMSTPEEYALLESFVTGEREFELTKEASPICIDDAYIARYSEILTGSEVDPYAVVRDMRQPESRWSGVYERLLFSNQYSSFEAFGNAGVQVFLDKTRPTTMTSVPLDVQLVVEQRLELHKDVTVTMDTFGAFVNAQHLARRRPAVEVYAVL